MSWLDDYLDYTAKQESPEVFNYWVGVTTIASVLQKRVWIDRGDDGIVYYKSHPGSFYTMLVSPPGIGHKSTAIRLGFQLMKSVGVKYVKDKGSTEDIIRKVGNIGAMSAGPGNTISNQPPDAIATIISPELSNLISKAKYAEQLTSFLIQAFDNEPTFEFNVGSNPVTLYNPTVTGLFGTNPEAIAKSLPSQAQEDGFLSRVIIVYYNKSTADKSKIPNSLMGIYKEAKDQEYIEERKKLKEKLVSGLIEIKKLSGRVTFTPKAVDFVDHWYTKWSQTPFHYVSGYESRRLDYMLKIATIIRAARHYDITIDLPDIEEADLRLREVEPKFQFALAFVGQSERDKNRQKILQALDALGGKGTARQVIMAVRKYFSGSSEFYDSWKFLVDAGFIKYYGHDVQRKEDIWEKI